MNWAQLGQDLLRAFEDWFAGTDWAGLASSLAELIGSMLGAAAGAAIFGSDESSYAVRADSLTNEDKRVLLVELTDNNIAADTDFGSFEYTYDKALCDKDTVIGALDYVFNVARDTEMVGVLVRLGHMTVRLPKPLMVLLVSYKVKSVSIITTVLPQLAHTAMVMVQVTPVAHLPTQILVPFLT